MKILHVLAQLPMKTGSGVYYTSMVEGLKKYQHEQKALFALQDDLVWNTLDDEDIYSISFKSANLPFPIAGMSDVMPYENTIYSSMSDKMIANWAKAFRTKLLSIKDEFTPDIIFAHHLWMLTSIVLDVFPNTKVIGICHNTDLRQAKMNPHLMEKYVINLSKLTLVFCASNQQKYEIANVYDIEIDKMVALGGGYNHEVFYYPLEKTYDGLIKLVFCAKIDPSKGIYELIQVYKALNLPNITLDIIGNPINENINKINEMIKDDPSIKLYNVKNQFELAEEFRKKDIFIMPSFYEGLGLTAIEALACSLYVVTTKIEALKDLLGEDINQSQIIKYIPLPGIYDTDKPIAEDLPQFRENLKEALLIQIEKVINQEQTHLDQQSNIKKLSWEGLVARMNEIINML